MMKQTLIAVAALFSASLALAVPAKKGIWRTLRLANGTDVKAELNGDEYGHYWQAADGKVYVKATDADCYTLASLTQLQQQATAKRSAANAVRMARAKVGAHTTYTGKKKALIILAQFPDKFFTGVTSKTDTEGMAAVKQLYNDIANKENYTSADGFTGSLYDYFKAQSGGQFELTFDVVGPYTTSRRSTHYGQDVNGTQDYYLGDFIKDVCDKADADVNFADYDWDGDGEADQVFILYAGQGQAAGGDESTIWPAEGKLTSVGSTVTAQTYDGVKVDTYACSCELGVNKTIDGIGTMCHEFAHCFGVPDMYDKQTNFGSTYRKYGMSYWDLMDFGNYNNNSFTPASFTSQERMYCGWLNPIELKNDTTVTSMKPLAEGGEAYIIYNDGHADEFYLLENRQLTGWDAGLPGKGLLILHVDYSESAWTGNDVNTTKERCTVFRAGNPGDNHATNDLTAVGTDPYPYNGLNSLTNATTPAATVNNANSDGSYYMNKQILDITQNADGTIAFTFKGGTGAGITEISNADASKAKAIYTLGGMRVGTDASLLKHGIYIIGGKKFVK